MLFSCSCFGELLPLYNWVLKATSLETTNWFLVHHKELSCCIRCRWDAYCWANFNHRTYEKKGDVLIIGMSLRLAFLFISNLLFKLTLFGCRCLWPPLSSEWLPLSFTILYRIIKGRRIYRCLWSPYWKMTWLCEFLVDLIQLARQNFFWPPLLFFFLFFSFSF